jgi:hypothetical protein
MFPAAHNVETNSIGWGVLAFFAVGIATLILGKYTDILRDAQPTNFGGAKPPTGVYRRPYSLAQTQMAWWFCIVAASFVFICLTKHQVANILTQGSLVLIGIGTGTAIGAAAIEQTKTDKPSTLNEFKATLEKIAALPANTNSPLLTTKRDELAARLASENFLKDILTDVDGVSLHRFQAAAWTAILGIIFVVEVIIHQAIPDFDALTLTLLGISGGTYLGFKVPENPA